MSRRYPRFSRRANSSLPGYDNLGYEDFGHPASQAQPALDDYAIDSEFGEEIHDGPYSSGPAPASYGWQPDHPAVSDEMVEDFEETQSLHDQNLKLAMERKASKCVEIAEHNLGKLASQEEIEDLALRYMDLPNRAINAKLQRIASDFLAGDALQEATGYVGDDDSVVAEHMAEEEIVAMMEDIMAEDDDHMAEEEVVAMMQDIMAENDHLSEEEVVAMMQDIMGEEHDAGEDLDNWSKNWGRDMLAEEHDADEMISPAEVLAEEISMLRSARTQSYTDDEVQEETGYEGDDEGEEDPEEAEIKLAGLSRLASVLDDVMGEEHDAESHEIMADLLAEMDRLAKKLNGKNYSCADLGGTKIPGKGGYCRFNEYGHSDWAQEHGVCKGMDLEDDEQVKECNEKRRAIQRGDKGNHWKGGQKGLTKQLHNDQYYRMNRHIWNGNKNNQGPAKQTGRKLNTKTIKTNDTRSKDGLGPGIRTRKEAHEEFLSDVMGRIAKKLKRSPNAGGNKNKLKGKKSPFDHAYSTAAPGWNYDTSAERVEKQQAYKKYKPHNPKAEEAYTNKVRKDQTDWGIPGTGQHKEQKKKYNKLYFQGNKDDFNEYWRMRREQDAKKKKKSKKAFLETTASDREMLAEILAEMEMQAMQADHTSGDHHATHFSTENEPVAEEDMLAELLAEIESSEMDAGQNDPSHFDSSHMAEEETSGFNMSAGDDVMGLDDSEEGIDPKLARIFNASDDDDSSEETQEDSSDDSSEETQEEAQEDSDSKESKKASFRPQTTARQSSVKTLGNISREASSASDELSKLWESAPDVSSFF